MKKILLFLFSLFLLTGCDDLTNTPQKQVEMFLSKYQTLDKDVLNDLDSVVALEETFNKDQREKHKNLMKKHYQGLVYDIKDYKEDGDKATVTVEIEVCDYSKTLAETNLYLASNRDEFLDNGEYSVIKFNDYRLAELEKTKDKVKYTLDLTLTKVNDKWQLDPISDDVEDKIHGIYSY